jgi:NurA-like 5'-3' nuclease
MKVTHLPPLNYGFIHTQRVDEQARIRHHENLKNLQKMNRQTIQNADNMRETQRLEMAKWDRVRQAKEAYLGNEAQKTGHNETMQHVDIKV